jgi:hypothetical protein
MVRLYDGELKLVEPLRTGRRHTAPTFIMGRFDRLRDLLWNAKQAAALAEKDIH